MLKRSSLILRILLLTALLLLAGLSVAAAQDDDDRDPPDLGQTLTVPEWDLSLAYPTGWQSEGQDDVFLMVADPADLDTLLPHDLILALLYVDDQTLSVADDRADSVIENFFVMQTVAERIEDITVAGQPGLTTYGIHRSNQAYAVMAVFDAPDEGVFVLLGFAPIASRDTMDAVFNAVLPTIHFGQTAPASK